MYPPAHAPAAADFSFDRLERLWERYPQYHEPATFSTMEELVREHTSWQEDFEEVRGEYAENQYDRFLVQLSWSDLPYRYAAGQKIRAAGPLMPNPYVKAFMEQIAGLDMYIPSLRTAIEYQGVQHYVPVDFFGGQEALEQRQALDLQKRALCEQNGVRLIEWAYDAEPTAANIKRLLSGMRDIMTASIIGGRRDTV